MKNRQTGAVLAVALIFMVLMTLVGVSTMRTSVISERMAGNYDNLNVAFQAAESALRDAEQDLLCEGCRENDSLSIHSVKGLTGFSDTCEEGLCFSATTSQDVLEDDDVNGNALLDQFIAFGDKTGAGTVPGVSQQPKYIIQGKKVWPPGADGWKVFYVITSVGYGKTENAKSILREKFIP